MSSSTAIAAPSRPRARSGRSPGRRLGCGARACFLSLASALATAGCQIPPDVTAIPRYIHDFFTNPNFVVNAPVAHELLGTARGAPDEGTREARFRLPPGFVMDVFASGIPIARYMRVTPRGDVLLTQPRKRRVLLLTRDDDGDGRSDDERVLLDGLHLPHGVELVGRDLFVAGPGYILRVEFDVEAGELRGEPEVFAELPETSSHALRPLRLGPDGFLYTAIGADCNVCEPASGREQTILRFDLETGREEIVASGFRNVAHFDWQPETNAMFATEVGVDYRGEDLPLEELNEILPGRFYGFPYLHGPGLRDSELAPGHEERIAASMPPAHTFTAHSTPLGITFLRHPRLPDDYRSAALVVLKGSWNRTRKTGYKVVSLHWVADAEREAEGDRHIEQREFVSGFERDEHVIGRPVDVVEGPDGSIFLSDDMAGAIYRIRYDPQRARTPSGGNENTVSISARHGESHASGPDGLETLDPVVRRDLRAEGEALYARHGCADCHEAKGSRPASVRLRAGLAKRHSIDDLARILGAPPASMPRFLLSEAERRALAVFLLEQDREARTRS
jgi:glucose/arabinose dehydrogenase